MNLTLLVPANETQFSLNLPLGSEIKIIQVDKEVKKIAVELGEHANICKTRNFKMIFSARPCHGSNDNEDQKMINSYHDKDASGIYYLMELLN